MSLRAYPWFAAVPQEFHSYFANRTPMVPLANQFRAGPVSFASHLGLPLSEALWEDLVLRLRARHLSIFPHDQSQWANGAHWPGRVSVHLDEQGRVADIFYTPEGPCP